MDEETTNTTITPERQAVLDRMAKARAGMGTGEKITGIGKPRVEREDKTKSLVKFPSKDASEGAAITETAEVAALKSQLAAVMERLNKVENPGAVQKAKRVKSYVGSLRVWEDGICTRIGSAKENFKVDADDPLRMLIDLDITDADGNVRTIKAPYMEWLMNADRVNVAFKKFDKGVRVETDVKRGGGGVGYRAAIDKEGRLTDRATGEEIDFEVEYTDIEITAVVTDEGPFKGMEFTFKGADTSAINC